MKVMFSGTLDYETALLVEQIARNKLIPKSEIYRRSIEEWVKRNAEGEKK